MPETKHFLVDVGMRDLPFPMRVTSREDPEGQFTIADISVTARIMQEFEARWIDRFIRILHSHRDRIGTSTLRTNILDYLDELNAATVHIEFAYPFFIEKLTPASKEKCLVRYSCAYSVRASRSVPGPRILFRIEVPCITTYPSSMPDEPGGLFGQLTVAAIEVATSQEVYPEDLVEVVDRHCLSPVYSFLTEEDQAAIIRKVHSEARSSVAMTGRVKDELARKPGIDWYSVQCSNFGMLHSYSTIIGTEKSAWVPFSGYPEDAL